MNDWSKKAFYKPLLELRYNYSIFIIYSITSAKESIETGLFRSPVTHSCQMRT